MKRFLIISVFTFAAFVTGFSLPASPPKSKRPVRNIILMIGDGMGVSEVYAGYTRNKGAMNFERFKTCGFSVTYSTSYVTDSGAGGTALATGYKTKNGSIGVDSTGSPVKSILEWASEKGKATGLISTSAITHATPASFIAHQVSRDSYELIAADFLKTPIDLFIGGGKDHFSHRKDSINLAAKLQEKGYKMVYTLEDVRLTDKTPVGALLAPEHMPRYSKGRGDMLPQSVAEAIRLLQPDPDGFFLMVEGSMIDWGGHANDLDYISEEVSDFDRAVGVALDFAAKNGETLVIVTADHETGGLSLPEGDLNKWTMKGSFSTKDHTGVMVPVFADGPHAELFGGIQQNTDIFFKMMKAFGFGGR